MKRILTIIILAIIINLPTSVKASHIYGGEITWECLKNGRYIFKMNIYRDCTGITYPFQTVSLEVYGNPLPRGANNSPISSILLKPDSNTWRANRNGDTSPECDPGSPQKSYACASQDQGTVQAFYYQSDPLILSGTPPVTGWRFVFQPPCCRNASDNVGGSSAIYRAIMYPDISGSNVDPCIDSSPEFRGLPASLVCRNYLFTYNNTAFDKDGDSIVYAWDRPYDGPGAAPTPVPYKAGYAYNNPTPGTAFHPQNVPSTLDPVSGVIKVALYSGSGVNKYLTVVRLDAYRDGVVIASVFREMPFIFFDCPPLPIGPGGVGGGQNYPPEVFIDGIPSEDTIADVIAGQTISLPFQARDFDYGGQSNGGLQMVTTVPEGFMFSESNTMDNESNCHDPSLVPCATLRNQNPIRNPITNPPRREISGLGGIATEFRWRVECHHVKISKTGVPGANYGIFNFVMRTFDNHCPIPGVNYPTITVRVRDPMPLTEPVMKGISVGLDGHFIYQWVPPLDTSKTFFGYDAEIASVNDNQSPAGAWIPLPPTIKNYKQQMPNNVYPLFNQLPNGNPNILSKRPGKDWYMQMLTLSGCLEDVASGYSDPVQVIEVEASPAGTGIRPPNSRVKLDWNRPTVQFPKTYPYFRYESKTHYYIWENDSIDSYGTYLGGEANPDNWYLRGDTSALTYQLNTNVCNGRVGFRIEARDTVITWKQGSGPGSDLDSLDTLTFRTFSMIDTMLMVDQGFVVPPLLDSIIVMPNGDVYFRIDKANAGPVKDFRIFDVTSGTSVKIADFDAQIDSFLYSGFNANNGIGKFRIGSVDDCGGNQATGDEYHTILPYGDLLDPLCAATYGLHWNVPKGFSAEIDRFEIYVDSTGNGWELHKSIYDKDADSTGITGIRINTNYLFKVVAIDKKGYYNSSAIISYQSPSSMRTFELVPAPEIQCTYVEDDGTVTLTFSTPRDSTNNGVSYQFDYQEQGGSWNTFSGSNAVAYGVDTTVTITGINALNAQYNFRSWTISGCDGVTPSENSSTVVSSIFVTAAADYADRDKPVFVNWNSNDAPNKTNIYYIYRSVGTPTTNPFFDGNLSDSSQSESYKDIKNGIFCDTINGYYVTIESRYDEDRSMCLSRSSFDTAHVKDVHPPEAQLIDFVTVNPQTEMLEIYWSNKADEDIDSLYFYHNIGEPGSNNLTIIGKESWYAYPQMIAIPIANLDVRDTSYYVTAQAIDGCGNSDDNYLNFDYHRNMDLDVVWNQCDSILTLDWNPYTYFNVGENDVKYTIYLDSTNSGTYTEVANSETRSNTYKHKVYQGNLRYKFYVKATNSIGNYASLSNIGSDSAFFQDEPVYGYLHYATVLPNTAVEIQMLKDVIVRQGSYEVYRGTVEDISRMNRIHSVNGTEVYNDDTFSFIDGNVETDKESYFYKIVTLNLCGGPVDTTNYARTIHLSVTPDNEALINTLKWNEYMEWDSTVAFYNIYRGFNGGEADELIATVAPSGKSYDTYEDNVHAHTKVKGRYCYKVEAVQGSINDMYEPMISSATSMSNIACATQKPLFYVPNAFAPDGVNKVFQPKGQFFDYSFYELIIFNRWGEKLFESRDIEIGWDGVYEGEIVPLGTYVYTIRLIDADGKEHKRKGTVTVIR